MDTIKLMKDVRVITFRMIVFLWHLLLFPGFFVFKEQLHMLYLVLICGLIR